MGITRPSQSSGNVQAFIGRIQHPVRKKDCEILMELIGYITDEEPTMWGESTVGFGTYEYIDENGDQRAWLLTGFMPNNLMMTIYVRAGFDRYDELLSQLGEYELGESSLYIDKLADIDIDVLSQLIGESVGYIRRELSL